jgi:hypothetical protein
MMTKALFAFAIRTKERVEFLRARLALIKLLIIANQCHYQHESRWAE